MSYFLENLLEDGWIIDSVTVDVLADGSALDQFHSLSASSLQESFRNVIQSFLRPKEMASCEATFDFSDSCEGCFIVFIQETWYIVVVGDNG